MDELSVFHGDDYQINSKIVLRHPTLEEIRAYGEQDYFALVRSICATPADRKVDIWDALHVFWDTVDEYELFVTAFSALRGVDASILFGGLDIESFQMSVKDNISEVVLVNRDGAVIDRAIYTLMTDYLREIHGMKKNTDVGDNDYTKEIMIDDDRDEMILQRSKPFRSILKPIISSLTNCPEFKYRWDDVWTLPIGVFMDSVQRVQKHKGYDYIMHGIYNGCVDIKKLNKKELQWMGDLK